MVRGMRVSQLILSGPSVSTMNSVMFASISSLQFEEKVKEKFSLILLFYFILQSLGENVFTSPTSSDLQISQQKIMKDNSFLSPQLRTRDVDTSCLEDSWGAAPGGITCSSTPSPPVPAPLCSDILCRSAAGTHVASHRSAGAQGLHACTGQLYRNTISISFITSQLPILNSQSQFPGFSSSLVV